MRPPIPTVGIERLSHVPRALYEAFHRLSAAQEVSPLRPAYRLRRVAGARNIFGAVPTQITAMPAQRFSVGQTVEVSWSTPQVGIPRLWTDAG